MRNDDVYRGTIAVMQPNGVWGWYRLPHDYCSLACWDKPNRHYSLIHVDDLDECRPELPVYQPMNGLQFIEPLNSHERGHVDRIRWGRVARMKRHDVTEPIGGVGTYPEYRKDIDDRGVGFDPLWRG